MMTTLDRRHGERARIPCKIPVELTDERMAAAFAADAVDLSVGGLSLRASCLPEVGKYLLCNFEAMPGGAHVLGRGEVVWTQPSGETGGEFGLRFVGIDPQTQALIDEMVAERIARIETPFTGPAPVVANLEIENVESPIAATLVRSGGGEALFEQPLDLLAIGRSVVAHAGVSLVRGSIARVDLRMDGGTPMLALTVRLTPDDTQFGEFDWEGDSGPDTEPDLFAPQGLSSAVQHELFSDESETTEPDSVVVARSVDIGSVSVSMPTPARIAEDQLALSFRCESVEDDELEVDEDGDDRPRLDLRLHADDRDAARYGLPSSEQVGAERLAGSDHDEWAHPLPDTTSKSPLVQTLRIFAAAQGALQGAVAPLGRGMGELRSRAGQRIVSSTQRMVSQARPRRTTAAAVGREPEGRGTLRMLGIGLMSIAAVALFAYALAPAQEDIALHRTVNPEPSELAVTTVASAKPVAKLEVPPPTAAAVASQPVVASAAAVPPTSPAPGTPAVGAVPAGSPYAVDVRKAGEVQKVLAAKPAPLSTVFGNKPVTNPKRFVLRMSSPVKAVQGSSDAHGFDVVIPGSLAHDRAAPIAAGHPAVARATIINRGDWSELNVRFVEGKTPAYRVSGQGATLEVLIGM